MMERNVTKFTHPNKSLLVIHLPEDISAETMEELEFEEHFVEQSLFVGTLSIIRDRFLKMGVDYILSNNIEPLDKTKLDGKELIFVCGVILDDVIDKLQKTTTNVVVISDCSFMHSYTNTVLSIYTQEYFMDSGTNSI